MIYFNFRTFDYNTLVRYSKLVYIYIYIYITCLSSDHHLFDFLDLVAANMPFA
jgi:hypothetical protein